MTTAWAHLPNAKHIDDVLGCASTVSLEQGQRAHRWSEMATTAWRRANNIATRHLDNQHPRFVRALSDSQRALALTPLNAAADAWATILALIAWDQAGAYYTMPIEALRMAARVGLPEPDRWMVELILPWREITEGETNSETC